MNDEDKKTEMNRGHKIMTISKSLAPYAPIAYELLHRIGLDRRRSRAIRLAACAGWIGVGMAVGSGLTLLLTPRSGPEMGDHLGEQGKRARDNGADGAASASPLL
jgi:hypothetical protein